MYILTLTNKKTNEVYVYDNVKDNNEGEKLYYRFQIDVQNLEDGEYDLECTKDGVLVGVNTLYIGDYQTHSLQYKRGENTFIDITLNAKLEEVVAEIDTTQATFTPNEEFDGISKIEINAQPVFDNGYAEGFESGNTEGFENGYSSGRTDGYTEGYEVGETNGYNVGYQSGKTDGYTEGYEVGETTGVNEFVNGLPSLTITQNGVYNETNKGVTVNVQTIDNSYFTGSVDESGLREIGWDDADIANFRDNINIYSWQNESYKVSDANKALYGVINANNIGDYANDPNLVFLPKFDGYVMNGNISSKYLKGMPLIHLKYYGEPLWFRFSDCVNLETVPPFEEEFYSTWETFRNCKSLKSIPNLKTRNATNMRHMFANCTVLQTIPQLDTGNVTNMQRMFENCSSLQSTPSLDTGNVANMEGMFENCISLKSISQLDTGNVTDMGKMFANCTVLTTIPQLDTSNVTNMGYMFQNCGSLTTIPQLDTSNVISMANMFQGCGNLTTIPLLDTSNVTDMSYLFNSCSSLIRIPELDMTNVVNVTNFASYCANLEEISNLNTINVQNFEQFLADSYPKKIGAIQMQSATSLRRFFYTIFGVYDTLTDMGGFIGLKINWNDNYGLAKCPNLSYQSCINILNGLADVTELGSRTLKVHSNFLTTVGDEISIGTNKGWTITA